MKTIAVIPAAGRGERLGQATPKQYITLCGVPIIVHTLRLFQGSQFIDDIILVVGKGEVDWVAKSIISGKGLTKIRDVIEGGKERQDSVAAGLEKIWDATEKDDILVIHDGARPFLDKGALARAVKQTTKTGACILGIKINETLKCIDNRGFIKQTLPAKGVWIAQTPQVFKAPLLKEAHMRAREDGFYGTDEASLVERLPHPVKVIPGSIWNIKITYPEDLKLAEEIMKMGDFS